MWASNHVIFPTIFTDLLYGSNASAKGSMNIRSMYSANDNKSEKKYCAVRLTASSWEGQQHSASHASGDYLWVKETLHAVYSILLYVTIMIV